MAEAITVPKVREVPVEEKLVHMREVSKRVRSELSKALREVWASDWGTEMRDTLSELAYRTGYAEELKRIAEEIGLGQRYKEAARYANIGAAYRLAWGKRGGRS